jgi:SAM-dependent methyltransferase
MLRQAEPRQIDGEKLDLIGRMGEQICPDDPALGTWYQTYRREHTRRLAADLAIIRRHVRSHSRVLEYGAVPLLLTAALSELDYQVHALDIAPGRFSSAANSLGLDVRQCDVEADTVPFADHSFDVVLFNELFEHLRINPIFTMQEAHRVLTPGGVLLLSTPNLRSFRGLRNLMVHNRGHAASPGGYSQYEKLETLGHMGHVREYTTREVSEFLTRVGFRPTTIIFRGGHGSGLVGLAERFLPAWRPFFTIVATKDAKGTSR